jgi:hypothetical protein
MQISRSTPLAIALGVAVPLSLSASAEPPTLAGTWTVNATPTTSTGLGAACPRGQDASGTWQWVVSVQPDGSVSATVVGQTGFPVLTGKLDGAHLSLSARKAGNVDGLMGSRLDDVSLFELELSGPKLTGTRTWLGFVQGGQIAGTATIVPAACAWRITGTRGS